MSRATHEEAAKAVSTLLDYIDPDTESATNQAKIAISYIQQSELLRKESLEKQAELLDALEMMLSLSDSDGPAKALAESVAQHVIAKAKGEQ